MAGVESRKEKRRGGLPRQFAEQSGGDGDAAARACPARRRAPGRRRWRRRRPANAARSRCLRAAPSAIHISTPTAISIAPMTNGLRHGPSAWSLSRQSGDADRNRCRWRAATAACDCAPASRRPWPQTEALADDLDPVAAEVEQDGDQRAEVQGRCRNRAIRPASRRARTMR